ncbi:hypothetical protein QZH41_015479, partial [Actinostola sp. cb2023]
MHMTFTLLHQHRIPMVLPFQKTGKNICRKTWTMQKGFWSFMKINVMRI